MLLREAGWPVLALLATSVLGLALIFGSTCHCDATRSCRWPGRTGGRMLLDRQDSPEVPEPPGTQFRWAVCWPKTVRHRHLPREELRNVVEDTGHAMAR